jgi:hypothetical protein
VRAGAESASLGASPGAWSASITLHGLRANSEFQYNGRMGTCPLDACACFMRKSVQPAVLHVHVAVVRPRLPTGRCFSPCPLSTMTSPKSLPAMRIGNARPSELPKRDATSEYDE